MFEENLLADPEFHTPADIDVLIGVDLFAGLFSGEAHTTQEGTVHVKTFFGIVFAGPAALQLPSQQPSFQPVISAFIDAELPGLSQQFDRFYEAEAAASTILFCANTEFSQQPRPLVEPTINAATLPIPEHFERFWALEEFAPKPHLTPDEVYCEEFYKQTTTQLDNKRYQVRLPFRPNHPPLGESRSQAEKRFVALEKRLDRDAVFAEQYRKFMKDYEDAGHMIPVTAPSPTDSFQGYYCPHHGVLKESSSSTKLRVVFDASAKSSTGLCLNDILLNGQKLQKDIRHVLLHFRRHPIAISADIRQMYLQIELHPDDWFYQLILWRKDKNEPILTYALATVAFGIKSSPFHALRTLKKLAQDFGHRFPKAAAIILNATYMDDIQFGASTEEEAQGLIEELIGLLACGGFTMHKWFSSHPQVLSTLPAEKLETPKLKFSQEENPWFSVLGIQWDGKGDEFSYEVNFRPHAETKRGILSMIASIYDPNGWLAPVIFRAKLFVKALFLLKQPWDAVVPLEMSQRWKEFFTELQEIRQIRIPRCLPAPNASHYELHCFVDASQKGYGCVLYLRSSPSPDSPATSVSLIMSKTRVAPITPVTLPRLELCGALLAETLLRANLHILHDHYDAAKIHCWTDSTIVLHWINTPPHELQTFVANRVAKIRELDHLITWHHVRSEDNVADLCSRSIAPADIVHNEFWWHGPAWLTKPDKEWPTFSPLPTPNTADLELKKCIAIELVSTAEQVTQQPTPEEESDARMEYALTLISKNDSELSKLQADYESLMGGS
nr:PREDICTED: uncharacterized protein LOC109036994 [Bemisia tabaci]